MHTDIVTPERNLSELPLIVGIPRHLGPDVASPVRRPVSDDPWDADLLANPDRDDEPGF